MQLYKYDKFIDYCKERGLKVNRKDLEYTEKEALFRPIMRVDGYYVNNTTELKKIYKTGHVIDPRQKGFVPGNNYYKKRERYREEIVHSYYHPYQFYSLVRLPLSSIRKRENFLSDYLENCRKNSTRHEKFLELLLFIQNKYLPRVKQPGCINIIGDSQNNLYDGWEDLQKKIIPKEIVSALGLKTEEIKEYRGLIGSYGGSIDPLGNWYDLIKYINYDKRQKLKGKALLAQDFYLISDMLALLLKDLTGEKQLETGSRSDSLQGRGKVRAYGKELNYVDRDILIRLLREYGINPMPILILIVEGYTEEIAFPIIANAMGIPLERYGVQIINIRGVDKDPREIIIKYATLDVYPFGNKYCIPLERTKVFLIFDNEGNTGSWIKKLIEKPDEEIEKMMKGVPR